MSGEDKNSKFVELANKRVNRAIKDLRLISNLANKKITNIQMSKHQKF